MQKGATLFQLRADGEVFFDGANLGVPIQRSLNAKMRSGGSGVTLEKGMIELGRQFE